MSRILPIVVIGIITTLIFSFLPQTSAQSSPQATGLFHLVLLKKLLLAQQSPIPKKVLPTQVTETKVLGSSTIDHQTALIQGINDYRETQGLSPVQISDETCAFAKIRAAEISHGFTHDGFQKRISEKNLPYTSWTKATENIAMTTNYTEVVTLWINSPGHAENMKANTPFVCVEQYGDYFAYEGMRP